MNLTIDIGNTEVKFGLFEKDKIEQVFDKDTPLNKIIAKHKIEKAIISRSGSDRKVLAIQKKLRTKKIETLILSHQTKLPIKILYKTPETLGVDRIAGSVAAQTLFPKNNILKIDFGTCITYDFVNINREYLGGAISPGIGMRFLAMHEFTKDLDLVFYRDIRSHELIGKDSYSSIVSGGVNGVVYEVSGIIKEYKKRYPNLKVIATGGNMSLFVPLLKYKIFARPYLVLEGLNRILTYNVSKKI